MRRSRVRLSVWARISPGRALFHRESADSTQTDQRTVGQLSVILLTRGAPRAWARVLPGSRSPCVKAISASGQSAAGRRATQRKCVGHDRRPESRGSTGRLTESSDEVERFRADAGPKKCRSGAGRTAKGPRDYELLKAARWEPEFGHDAALGRGAQSADHRLCDRRRSRQARGAGSSG